MPNGSPRPDPENVRIGTDEREEAAQLLGQHYSQGRLSTDEYEQRVDAAFTAENRAELRPLFADLPEPQPMSLRPPAAVPPPVVGLPGVPNYGFVPYGGPPPYAPYVPPYGAVPVPYSDKSKLTAGLLQILVPIGAGRFYTGQAGIGVAQLLVVLVTCGVGAIWPVIDGIVLLANGGYDNYGRRLRG